MSWFYFLLQKVEERLKLSGNFIIMTNPISI